MEEAEELQDPAEEVPEAIRFLSKRASSATITKTVGDGGKLHVKDHEDEKNKRGCSSKSISSTKLKSEQYTSGLAYCVGNSKIFPGDGINECHFD